VNPDQATPILSESQATTDGSRRLASPPERVWAYDSRAGGAMDVVVVLAVLIVLSAPVALVAPFASARGPEFIGQAFVPWRPDGWPQGVQEEDPSFQTTWRLGPTGALGTGAPREGQEDRDSTPTPVAVSVTGSRPRLRQGCS
jgi:hypothetical protein